MLKVWRCSGPFTTSFSCSPNWTAGKHRHPSLSLTVRQSTWKKTNSIIPRRTGAELPENWDFSWIWKCSCSLLKGIIWIVVHVELHTKLMHMWVGARPNQDASSCEKALKHIPKASIWLWLKKKKNLELNKRTNHTVHWAGTWLDKVKTTPPPSRIYWI